MKRIIGLTLMGVLSLTTACQGDNSLINRDGPNDEPVDIDTDVVVDGEHPDIEISPESLSFDSLEPDCQSAPQTVTIKNVGAAQLNMTDIRLAGDGPSAYLIGGPPNGTLAPGEELLLSVSFKPGSNLQYDARVEVDSNDPDEPTVQTALDGLGADFTFNEEVFKQAEPGPVDILWAIDASCSMSNEVNELAKQFDTFINTFVNLGLDYQLGVTTTDASGAADSGRLLGAGVISESLSGSTANVKTDFMAAVNAANNGLAGEAGLGATYYALTEPHISTNNAGFIRDNARLEVIVISDEPEQTDHANLISPSGYITWLDGLKASPDDSSFSGVIGPRTGGCMLFLSGTSADAAPLYHDVIDATGGVWIDLCQSDFASMMAYLSYQAAGIVGAWELTDEPANFNMITVTVDGQDVPFSGVEGWAYDGFTNAIEFRGTWIPGPGADIVITYPVRGECPVP